MPKISLSFLGFLLFLGLGFKAVAQEGNSAYKAFEKEKIEQLKADDTYSYPERYAKDPESFWDKFKRWLGQLINISPRAATWEYILYLVAFIVLLWAIIRLLKVQYNSTFSSPKQASALSYSQTEEDIASTNFHEEIAKAVANKNYALVVRLHYLHALQILSHKGIIHVASGKTNYDYFYEINNSKLKEPFSDLARLFDYVWYGEFTATKKHHQQGEALVTQLKQAQKAAQHEE